MCVYICILSLTIILLIFIFKVYIQHIYGFKTFNIGTGLLKTHLHTEKNYIRMHVEEIK